MKAELTLPQELVDRIADKVIEKLKPVLSSHSRREAEDIIFDVTGLSEYLIVSKKWVYANQKDMNMPYYKIGGFIRFSKKSIDKWMNGYYIPAINSTERILKAIK